MKSRYRVIARLFVVMVSFASLNANAGTIEFRPVGGAGNDITVLAGTQVTVDIFASGYAPSVLLGYQINLDVDDFANGIGADLVPFSPACTSTPECEAALGVGALCDSPTHPPGCTAGFVNAARGDYIFASANATPLSNATDQNAYYMASFIIGDGASDPGGLNYMATLVLDVPLGAEGTYAVVFDPFPDTALQNDQSELVAGVTLVPASITVTGSVPATSEWGLAVMALILVTGGTLLLTRGRASLTAG